MNPADAPTATLTIPMLHLGRGENEREHWNARAKRIKQERGMVFNTFFAARVRGTLVLPPGPPYRVTLTRLAPSDGLDFDNLVSAFKSVRDQVTISLGLVKRDRRGREYALDGPGDPIGFEYRQERGPWGIRIDVQAEQAMAKAVP